MLGNGSCLAEDTSYTCLPYIDVISSIDPPPVGWQVLQRNSDKNAKHFLEYVIFTDGHPKKLAYLRPTSEKEVVYGNEKLTKSIFTFSTVSSEGIYLVCGYKRTDIQLYRNIGLKYTKCEVLSSKEGSLIKSIRCKSMSLT